MQQFRQCPPAEINGAAVVEVRDYLSSQAKNMLTGLVTPVLLPKSDVIQYFISDGSKITMRPSGTEPKIKFYFSVKGQLRNANEYDTAERELAQKIENIRRSLHL